MIIDAKDCIVGRIATVAAKQALLGNEVIVINCKDAVMTGRKAFLKDAYERKRSMGAPRKGPVHIRSADRLVKRIIRGMLPHHQPRGYEALRRIKCYTTVPATLGKDITILKEAHVSKTAARYMTIGSIVKHIGGKE